MAVSVNALISLIAMICLVSYDIMTSVLMYTANTHALGHCNFYPWHTSLMVGGKWLKAVSEQPKNGKFCSQAGKMKRKSQIQTGPVQRGRERLR